MKVTRLTKREADIMEIFWRSDKPLSSNDIHSLAPEISINTIQPNLRKLNEKGYIEVAGVGFTRNSITREYQPSSRRRNISAPFWMRRLLTNWPFPTLKNVMTPSG